MLGIIILGGVALAAITYVFILPIAKYFYDPKGLRKYPNFSPFSGLTDLRHIYLSACGYRSRDLYIAHKQAPILRTGPNSLSFGDIRAVKDIYGHSTKCTKDLNYVVLGGSHEHLFDVVGKDEHSRKRKTLSAAFTIKNLERWEFKVAYTTQRLKVPDPGDLTLDFGKWINLFTIEAINNIALSSSMDLLETGTDMVTAQKKDGTTYPARYRHAQNQTALGQAVRVWDYNHYPILANLSKLIPKWRKVWKEAEPWDDVVYHQAVTRLKRYLWGEKLDDFFSSLMEDKQGPGASPANPVIAEPPAPYQDQYLEFRDPGVFWHDKTRRWIAMISLAKLQNPHCLQILQEELDEVLDDDGIVAPYDKVKDLPYLRACLDEALRIIPPTSAGLPRRTPPEGAQIMGEWIPGDTSVSMTIYATHRDSTIFPDPEEYRPERWLDKEARRRMEPYFIPFSAGARGCLGRNISYLEQIVVLASLVHCYDFALPSPGWRLARHEAFNLIVGEMPIKIWRRERGEVGA